MMRNKFKEYLITPFRSENRINKVLILIFLLINTIVLLNAFLHSPSIGYDSGDHLSYISILSKFRLPAPPDTTQFFAPPLPYFLPSLLCSSGAFDIKKIGKFAQFLNVLFSIGLTFYLLKICEIIRPNNMNFKIFSLFFMGMLPVYYKTFAFVRGEPLLVFLSVFAIYKTLDIFAKKNLKPGNISALGLSLGLLILTRQWGFFLFPAIAIFVAILLFKQRQKRLLILGAITLSFIIAFTIGGWFYIHLYNEYGTVKAFNRQPAATFSFSNQPSEFYFNLGLNKLFSDPIRKAFPNLFFPKFYSEFWGDYECYFSVYGKDKRDNSFKSGLDLEWILKKEPLPLWFETNRYEIGKYLGRVNFVSLFPSLFFLAGIILGMVYFVRFVFNYFSDDRVMMHSLLYLAVALSFIGYFWFLIMYPNPNKGDTIKATYMLQTYPFISILAGEFLQLIKRKSVRLYQAILILLVITALHNFPVFITRYIL